MTQFALVLHDVFNYQLPKGPVKAGRRWEQRHPQGANFGSNGILRVPLIALYSAWLGPVKCKQHKPYLVH